MTIKKDRTWETNGGYPHHNVAVYKDFGLTDPPGSFRIAINSKSSEDAWWEAGCVPKELIHEVLDFIKVTVIEMMGET